MESDKILTKNDLRDLHRVDYDKEHQRAIILVPAGYSFYHSNKKYPSGTELKLFGLIALTQFDLQEWQSTNNIFKDDGTIYISKIGNQPRGNFALE